MRGYARKALTASAVIAALTLTSCTSSKPSTSASSRGTSSGAGQVAGTKGTGTMADCGINPNTCNSGKTKPGGTVQYAIPENVTGWNVNAANSANVDFEQVLAGVLPAAYNIGPDLKPFLETDVLSSATMASTNPQTIVYQIKSNATWNDGTPIDANDFVYAWKANSLTYCPKCGSAFTAGYNLIKSVSGSDNGKTVTVIFGSPFAEWQSLFSPLYPAHLAAQHGGMADAAGLARSYMWFDTTVPSYSGGPYDIQSVVKDTAITEVPNPKWYGAVKPTLSKLIFRVITEQGQQVLALQNNELQAIYFSPTADIVQAVNRIGGLDTFLGPGASWEHLDFNEKNPLLADRQLRSAIFTAIDRQAIIDRTIGEFVPDAKALNNHMYALGQSGYQDNVTPTGQGAGDVAKAKSILTAAGYTGVGTALKNKAGNAVHLRCSYQAGSTIHQQTCEIVQSELAALGISVAPTAVADPGGALASGDFDLFDFVWIFAPFPVSNAQAIFDRSGGVDFGGNDDPAMESLLKQASTATDPDAVRRLVNQADVDLTNDAYELPLYQKPFLIAARANIANIRGNSTLGPTYNDQAWGIRSN